MGYTVIKARDNKDLIDMKFR